MGKLIVIDGLDGCGKHTQAEILKSRLENEGHKVKLVSFPNYSSLSSGPVRMYLGGEISDNPEDINPYMAASFYIVDRAISYYKEIKRFYDEGYIIISDRYISSNIIYQTSKIKDKEEAETFIKWDYDFEINKNKIPKEDIVICLTLPIETSQKLMSGRYKGDENLKDIHEKDIEYLNKCHDNLEFIAETANRLGYNYRLVDCSGPDKEILNADKITEILYGYIKYLI